MLAAPLRNTVRERTGSLPPVAPSSVAFSITVAESSGGKSAAMDSLLKVLRPKFHLFIRLVLSSAAPRRWKRDFAAMIR